MRRSRKWWASLDLAVLLVTDELVGWLGGWMDGGVMGKITDDGKVVATTGEETNPGAAVASFICTGESRSSMAQGS